MIINFKNERPGFMYNITLLSSFHNELGKCNSTELYKIIEEIQPEVIFEELSRDVFNMIYSGGWSPRSLEAITIKKYLKQYSIKHIPVDTCEKSEADFFNGYDIISNKSFEYTQLLKQQLLLISLHGYLFLNNKSHIELLDKMHIIEEDVLSDMNDFELSNQYRLEMNLHDRREDKMLENIYNYSKQYPYDTALFVCGAEHRKSVIEKILKCEWDEKIKLNWVFYECQDLPII